MEQPPKPDTDTPVEDWLLRPRMPGLDMFSRRLSIVADPDALRTLYLLEARNEPVPSSDLPADQDLLLALNQAQYIRKIDGRERQWTILFDGQRMLYGLWETQHGDPRLDNGVESPAESGYQ